VDHPSATSEAAARLTAESLDGWAACIGAVNAEGGAMFLQLWHEGAVRPHEEASPSLSPSGLVQAGKPNGRAATRRELDEIRDAFVRGATAARDMGAAGVEVHCAHGYGLDLFLWHETNVREDGLGGPAIEDRVRFPAEIVAAIRAACGDDFLIGLRFSQWKTVDYDARIVETPQELATMLVSLRRAGVDIFHPSTRRFWVPEWPPSQLGLAGWTRSFTDAAVIAVGSVGLDCDVMDSYLGGQQAGFSTDGLAELVERFDRGEFDLVAVGRSLIGDPDWIAKVAEGRFDDVRKFTNQDLFAQVADWDIGFVAEAHGLKQGEGVLDFAARS
jgi:2,4-dienoyl-CoA reductase-like NADH-dependent reductase (Old Yellow Enzyme family)